ncbi:MAG: 3-hydroxyacyl-CoA dehydrogenase NAD-binding domain-containing protein, partial [Rhodospirillaceae bacterium]|nr:3-hydroxyacyl-CoA dehydrogenase NAD-binding domain-containing protein [Rhodospirillaceae bacterium]
GRLNADARAERLARLTGVISMNDLNGCDLVIEAAFEDLAIKRRIFQALDSICAPGTILASNTSTLNLDDIAATTRRPADVLGMHFFSPAHVMRLLEVVRGARTAPDALATVMAVAKRINKVAVVSGVCFGFIGNRMFEGYIRESQMLLLEGATPSQVDAALTDFGMAMGPCAVIDLAGVDVSYLTREGNRANLPADPRYCLIGDKLHHLGRHGQKTGQGFYRYADGKAVPDTEVEQLIRGEAQRLGIAQRTIGAEEIVSRCITPLISEGAQILDEGIALRAVDIDVVWCTGYGFPRFRGGPMFHADGFGLAAVVADMARFADRLGNTFGYWTPAPLLARLAREGRTFAEFAAGKTEPARP